MPRYAVIPSSMKKSSLRSRDHSVLFRAEFFDSVKCQPSIAFIFDIGGLGVYQQRLSGVIAQQRNVMPCEPLESESARSNQIQYSRGRQ